MVAPSLIVNQAENPFVEVFYDEYLPGTQKARIERVSDGRVWPVRGGVDVTPGVAVLDFEVPFCVPSVYRAECFDFSGMSLGFTESASTTVWEWRTIVHQPLVPQLWTAIRELKGTAETIERPADSDLVKIEGSPLPRAIGSGRRGVTSMPYKMFVDRVSAADRIQEMLGTHATPQLPVLCVRTPPPMRVPRTFFMHVPSLPERQIAPGANEYFSFDFDATEVEIPFPGLVTPLLTYDDLDAAFGSYDAMDAAFPSYTDRDRAYHLAGTA